MQSKYFTNDKKNNLLPIIVFTFCGKNLELLAKCITTNLWEDDSKRHPKSKFGNNDIESAGL